MGTIIFIAVAVIVITLTLYYTMKKKIHCPNCKSTSITSTGKKQYKEKPALAIMGSPDSYNEIEFKCNKCGHLFFEKQRTVIFN